MVFSSYEFIFLFLPIVLIVYYLMSNWKDKMYQHLFLVAASLFFYGYFNISYLIIMLASIIVNYVLAKAMSIIRLKAINNSGTADKDKAFTLKVLLTIGILFNIGMLGYYKYYDFFIENINAVLGTEFVLKHILLPLGISFFTFQQFSFLISIYKGEEKLENFVDYCLFVTFFPQLVAGPIVLYSEMMPQFTDESRRKLNFDHFSKGIYIFVIGFFKKTVIADTVALFVNNGLTNVWEHNAATAWITALSYTVQIYFDFSGYSDMAIGLGKLFNIDLPANFLSPYKSKSITEFWRRWHITLGRALSTYVYIPLGGNRKGKVRTYINLFVTFLASGLWHGANWTFVIWGIMHGICIVFERVTKKTLEKIPGFIRIAATFFLVNFFWVLFRADNIGQAMDVYKGMVNFSNISMASLLPLTADNLIGFPALVNMVYILGMLGILYIIVFCTENTIERAKGFSPTVKRLVFTVVLLSISIIHLSRESIFIYFNF